MDNGKTKAGKFSIILLVLVVILSVAVGIVTTLTLDRSLQENVSNRARSELKGTAEEEIKMVDHEVSDHLYAISLTAELVGDAAGFQNEDNQRILATLTEENTWETIGFSDTEGNACSRTGQTLGNVSDFPFFKELINGEGQNGVYYLPRFDESRVSKIIFAAPCQKDGKITGIVFAFVDAKFFDSILLNSTASNTVTELYLCDADGRIILTNETAKDHLHGTNFFEQHGDGTYSDGMSEASVKATMQNGENGTYVFQRSAQYDGKENIYFEQCPRSGWYVFAVADVHASEEKYRENQLVIRNAVKGIVIAFFIVIFLTIGVILLFMRKLSGCEKEHHFERKRTETLMRAMKCEQYVYDVSTGRIRIEGERAENLELTSELTLEELAKSGFFYPGSDLKKIEALIGQVIKERTPQTMVFPIDQNGETVWLDVTMVPYCKTGDRTTHVFASVLNVTGEHLEFEKHLGIMPKAPGGFHRCYLDDPIHLEYVSEGLYKLLGYSEEEFAALVDQNTYSLAICEEDRPKFREFVRKLAAEPMTGTCEYRMICKDGTLKAVLDTMESIRGADGIMYGYSAVFNISEKAQELEEAKKIIEENSEKEKLLLEEQKNLSTAAKSVYSLIISLDLTGNTYKVIDNAKDLIQMRETGSLEELIEARSARIPEKKEAEEFEALFNRQALLLAYYAGKKHVNLRHRQTDQEGEVHWLDSGVYFLHPEESGGKITAVILAKIVDDDQRQIEWTQELLRKESVYHNALMTRSVGYLETNLTTGLIEGDIFVCEKGKDAPEVLKIPGLGKPVGYDQFEKWWAEYMLVSEPETFLRFSNCAYLLSQYAQGRHYVEVACTVRNFENEEREWRQMYFLTQNHHNGDIMAMCLINDITDQEERKREIEHLTEELMDARVKNSVSQMQPHFLYNALLAIREITLEEPQYASDLLLDFTTHLRACIRAMTNSDLIPFSKEMENIRAYCNIERMRFGEKLVIVYRIECEDFMIIPLSIQPLVENAIRHGVYPRGIKGGTVTISTFRTEQYDCVMVSDDGVGFDYEAVCEEVKKGERDSLGLCNLIFRLEKIMHAKVSITSKKDSGTDVLVEIPRTQIIRSDQI